MPPAIIGFALNALLMVGAVAVTVTQAPEPGVATPPPAALSVMSANKFVTSVMRLLPLVLPACGQAPTV